MHILHFILVALSTFCPVCMSFQFTFTEGELAELRYPYSLEEPLNIQLRIGENAPFFQNGRKVVDMLTASQYKRFKIKISAVQSNRRIVHLQIQKISRADAGEYICEVVRDGSIVEHITQKFSIFIEYPPGRASCTLSTVKKVHFGINEIWEMMNCTAITGTEPGYIKCFQNNEQLPPWTIPISNQTHTLQKIWVRTTFPLVCCSSTYRLPKKQCECNDYAWSPDNTTKANSCSQSSTSSLYKKSSTHEPYIKEDKENRFTQEGPTVTYKSTDTGNEEQTLVVKLEGESKSMMLSISLIIIASVFLLANTIFMLYCFQRVESRLTSDLKDIKKSVEEMKKCSKAE